MRRIEADADAPAPASHLGHRRIADLPIAGDDGPGVAVRADDGPAPQLEGIRHRLLGHVAQVEDHALSPHRLQQLDAEVGETPRRTRATAVAGSAPGPPDDPQAEVRPRPDLRWGFYPAGAFPQQDRRDPASLPAA